MTENYIFYDTKDIEAVVRFIQNKYNKPVFDLKSAAGPDRHGTELQYYVRHCWITVTKLYRDYISGYSEDVIFYDMRAATYIERCIKNKIHVEMTNIVRTNDNGYIIKYYKYDSGWHTLTENEYSELYVGL